MGAAISLNGSRSVKYIGDDVLHPFAGMAFGAAYELRVCQRSIFIQEAVLYYWHLLGALAVSLPREGGQRAAGQFHKKKRHESAW